MLHLFTNTSILPEFLERIAPGDDVVLLQASTWAALMANRHNPELSGLLAQSSNLFVLVEMLKLYGIQPHRLLPGVAIIDYSGLVDLAVKNEQIATWN
jgi:tRNA 2-thiouridine synthesizing protein B